MIPRPHILDWSGFLARPGVPAPPSEMLDQLAGVPILIVGAGGSIASALVSRLIRLQPSELVLLDASESHLDALVRQCKPGRPTVPISFQLGSIADRSLLEEIFAAHAPRLVFHAAAFKHVPLLEEQPLAAIDNNIFATRILAEAAGDARIILLSTDKVVQPASILGATKRITEQIVLSAGGTALRLGNVLGTRGSVVEVFASQIARGGPLTVTVPAAERYFLTIDEAVNLLLAAAVEPRSALLAPALPAPHRIVDLAHFMVRELAPDRAIPTTYTGLRAGEKESEEFWTASEQPAPANASTLFTLQSLAAGRETLHKVLTQLRAAVDQRDITAALRHIRTLVPDYTPGEELLALAGNHTKRVHA